MANLYPSHVQMFADLDDEACAASSDPVPQPDTDGGVSSVQNYEQFLIGSDPTMSSTAATEPGLPGPHQSFNGVSSSSAYDGSSDATSDDHPELNTLVDPRTAIPSPPYYLTFNDVSSSSTVLSGEPLSSTTTLVIPAHCLFLGANETFQVASESTRDSVSPSSSTSNESTVSTLTLDTNGREDLGTMAQGISTVTHDLSTTSKNTVTEDMCGVPFADPPVLSTGELAQLWSYVVPNGSRYHDGSDTDTASASESSKEELSPLPLKERRKARGKAASKRRQNDEEYKMKHRMSEKDRRDKVRREFDALQDQLREITGNSQRRISKVDMVTMGHAFCDEQEKREDELKQELEELEASWIKLREEEEQLMKRMSELVKGPLRKV